jgi:hypothetical protein
MLEDAVEESVEPSCEHAPAVGYVVEFDVRDGVDEIESACSMGATVEATDPDDPAADAVGCDVETCANYHETVAADLRRTAARHSGNVTGDDPSC